MSGSTRERRLDGPHRARHGRMAELDDGVVPHAVAAGTQQLTLISTPPASTSVRWQPRRTPPPAPIVHAVAGSACRCQGRFRPRTSTTAAKGWPTTTPAPATAAARTGRLTWTSSRRDGNYDVGWTDAGEWLNYSVNVASAGTYPVQLRVAALAGGTLHVDSMAYGTAVPLPATGGWQNWTAVSFTTSLAAGPQKMTLYFDTGGFNVGAITVSTSGSSTRGRWNVDGWWWNNGRRDNGRRRNNGSRANRHADRTGQQRVVHRSGKHHHERHRRCDRRDDHQSRLLQGIDADCVGPRPRIGELEQRRRRHVLTHGEGDQQRRTDLDVGGRVGDGQRGEHRRNGRHRRYAGPAALAFRPAVRCSMTSRAASGRHRAAMPCGSTIRKARPAR